MLLDSIKENKIFRKLILLAAVLLLASVVVPMQAHAASATKTKKVTIRVGQSSKLKLKGVNKKLKWKSLDRKKVTVTKSGKIKAKKKGSTTVRVEYEGVTYNFKIKVYKRKKNQKSTAKTVTMTLKKTADSAAQAEAETEEAELQNFSTAKYSGLKTNASGSFAVKDIIMIGDSRFVGMHGVVGGKATWYCKVGMGLEWLKETVNLPKLIKNKKIDLKDKAVVFNLGVNDVNNMNDYISYLNSLGSILRREGAKTYFMTVNPIDDKAASKWSLVRNSMVISFNKKMAAGLKDFGLIDTYDELVFHKFSTVDGVHYTAATYKTIYSYMLECIGA